MTALFYCLPALFLCASCTMARQMSAQSAFLSQDDRKQKQKILVLQKKLSQAESVLQKSQEEVEGLRYSLCNAQLEVIESQIEQFERKWEINPASLAAALRRDAQNLFFEEREILYQLLQIGPASHRAQCLLDRILQLITQIGDAGF